MDPVSPLAHSLVTVLTPAHLIGHLLFILNNLSSSKFFPVLQVILGSTTPRELRAHSGHHSKVFTGSPCPGLTPGWRAHSLATALAPQSALPLAGERLVTQGNARFFRETESTTDRWSSWATKAGWHLQISLRIGEVFVQTAWQLDTTLCPLFPKCS